MAGEDRTMTPGRPDEAYREECAELRAQLEASQASEARLREALTRLVSWKDPASLCAPELGGMLTAMYAAEAVLDATTPNPVNAVVEAARTWAAWKHNAFVTVTADTEGDLARAVAALEAKQ